MPNKPKRYIDPKGNTYHVEQAANKKWVAIRINAGGHRKFFKYCELNECPDSFDDNDADIWDEWAEKHLVGECGICNNYEHN